MKPSESKYCLILLWSNVQYLCLKTSLVNLLIQTILEQFLTFLYYEIVNNKKNNIENNPTDLLTDLLG